jgi:hypothetical protein
MYAMGRAGASIGRSDDRVKRSRMTRPEVIKSTINVVVVRKSERRGHAAGPSVFGKWQ